MEATRRTFLGRTVATAIAAAPVSLALGVSTPAAALSNTAAAGSSTPIGSSSELPSQSQWNAVSGSHSVRRLRLVNVHTQEKISVVYRKGDHYVDQALQQINFLLRDYRVNKVKEIDPATIDYLYQIYNSMETDEYIQILSGYRTPATNEMLRKRSRGVAKNSLHIVGRAIDLRIPGRSTRELQRAALDLKLGGIGYYQKSDFVHIDSGHFRHW